MTTEIAKMKLSDIQPAKYNPRVDLQPGEEKYERLKESIDTFGLVKPLVVNKRNNVLVSGHQRMKILISAGGCGITDVILVDLDEDKERLLNAALNRIDGDWDYQKLSELFAEYEIEELLSTGFTRAEIESLYAETEADGSEYAPVTNDDEPEDEEPGDELDRFLQNDDRPCTVYLSFSDKEAAEGWLKDQGIERSFEKSQNIIVKMEGTAYGTASN